MRLRVSPVPASTAGSIMNPTKLELCILRRNRGMNLRVQSGVAYSSGPGCLPDLASSFHLPDWPACETAQKNRACIVLPESNCLPNSLQVHQLETELRPGRTVNASAKVNLICGFHKSWCISQNFQAAGELIDPSPRKLTPVLHLLTQLAPSIYANKFAMCTGNCALKTYPQWLMSPVVDPPFHRLHWNSLSADCKSGPPPLANPLGLVTRRRRRTDST